MKNYFKNTKIAICFESKQEHANILEYFEMSQLLFNKGVCSFYYQPTSDGFCGIYQCYGVNTFPKNYTLINFQEFQFIIDENKVLDL